MLNQNYELNTEEFISQLENMMNAVSSTMKNINENITTAMSNLNIQFSNVSESINASNSSFNLYDTTQKMVTSSISVASAALGVLNGVVMLVDTSQKALNLTVLQNPYVIAVAAITALVATLGLLGSSMSDENAKHQETMDAINSEITARNDLRAKQQEQLTANLAEINNVNSLNDELSILVDTEGNVKAGSEERVKGCPYDNAVAEATYKIVKTEFAFNRRFNDFEELERELFDYVNWYNNIRIHGSLGYLTPVAYRQAVL